MSRCGQASTTAKRRGGRDGLAWRFVRGWGLAAFALGACASTRGYSGALEPRFVAVHNALAALGLVQVGPIHEGVLAQGREGRVALSLAPGCTTIAAVGGEGVRDLDATLVDSRGRSLAHDTTNEPQAVLRTCVEAADSYVLILSVGAGSGSWVVATWQGGIGAASGAATPPGASSARDSVGTCDSPISLTAGTVTGSTIGGEHENAGSCEQSDSREIVYQLDVPRRQRVVIEVEARFDSVLYVRKDDCADPNAEVDCSDDAPDRTHSRIERVLEPGRYFVFVDGYSHDAGSFKITVATTDVLALRDVCRGAPLLALGGSSDGTTATMGNDAEATCGGGAEGADAPWRLDLPFRSRLRIVEHSEDMTPVLHVRRACEEEPSEVACGESGAASGDAVVTGIFDPGAYTVFADARDREATGRYSLQSDVGPPTGSGTSGDACADAVLLGATPSVSGDTFAAHDDVAGTCGGAGAADVIYRFEIARRSRFVAALQAEEGPHILVAWRRCGDRSAEVACGRDIDEILLPGTYFLAVDGASEDAFGRFTLTWSAQDLTGQSGACLAAPTLTEGAVVSGTTAGAGDRFGPSCAGADGLASGPDRVYELVLPRRTHVRVTVTAPSFDAVVAVRKACADTSGGARAAELLCEAGSDVGHRTLLDRTLEIGTYWILVDGQTPNDQGPFTIDYRVVK